MPQYKLQEICHIIFSHYFVFLLSLGELDYRNRRPSYASKKRRVYSLLKLDLPELTRRNASFSSWISIAEGEE